jgi:hypothetical protein
MIAKTKGGTSYPNKRDSLVCSRGPSEVMAKEF